MVLKSLFVGLMLFSAFPSWAMSLVPAYNENYCPNIDAIAPVIRTSPNGEHLFETHRLMIMLGKWNDALIAAEDTVLAEKTSPLCVGLMDDGGSPNAGALGSQFILMGVTLLNKLETENGVGTPAKEVKEKFVLAHEYAHVLQNLHRLKFDYTLPMLSTKIKEQHADCMAAYMMGLSNDIPEELSNDLEFFIQELADAHIVGDHGTAEQRIAAYNNGRGIARVQKALLGKTLSTTTSTQLVRECAVYYTPTNLK